MDINFRKINLVLIITCGLLGTNLQVCHANSFDLDAKELVNFPKSTTEISFPFGKVGSPKFVLGKNLFFDKILSGNRNISCATCHHPSLGSGDRRMLPIGEKGLGLGVLRRFEYGQFSPARLIGRNSQPLYNLGAKNFKILFHDGRVEFDENFPFNHKTPANSHLPRGLEGPLATQALFPIVSIMEMAGHPDWSDISKEFDFFRDEPLPKKLPKAWDKIVNRLQKNPKYLMLFKKVYQEIQSKDDLTIVHIANAIGFFEALAFRADNSLFDKFLRGEATLDDGQKRGLYIFYGSGGCSKCHSGIFQTDQKFYSLGVPNIGYGKRDGISGKEDFGRERVTGNPNDRYKFRTPSLRNVEITGPYGHNGLFHTLQDIIWQHVDPDFLFNREKQKKFKTNELFRLAPTMIKLDIQPRPSVKKLSASEMDDLIIFLKTLTDKVDFTPPIAVPSGLPVKD